MIQARERMTKYRKAMKDAKLPILRENRPFFCKIHGSLSGKQIRLQRVYRQVNMIEFHRRCRKCEKDYEKRRRHKDKQKGNVLIDAIAQQYAIPNVPDFVVKAKEAQ